MKNEYLEGGRICTAHGVAGALKLEHYCNEPKILAKQKRIFLKCRDGSYKEHAVKSASVSGQFVIMSLDGISSREEAIAYRGVTVYLHRNDLPLKRGEMFVADMIGLPVIHAESGESLGEISDVSDVAGRRIYTINYCGKSVLLPHANDFIKEIREDGMRVLPIPGFFDEADEV
jgi:16S rRNA processing protein RimM